jgi:hypothetical protein
MLKQLHNLINQTNKFPFYEKLESLKIWSYNSYNNEI